MYAVIRTGGKQYRVNEGDVLRIEKLKGDVGGAGLPARVHRCPWRPPMVDDLELANLELLAHLHFIEQHAGHFFDVALRGLAARNPMGQQRRAGVHGFSPSFVVFELATQRIDHVVDSLLVDLPRSVCCGRHREARTGRAT